MSGQLRDARDQSQPQFSLTLKAVPLKPIDASRQRAIILVSRSKNIRMEPSMNSVDQNLPSSAASAVEVRRLLEENARLRSLLIAHSIPIPETAQPTLHLPQTLNAALEVRKPGVATAEQRIALFRSLFRGREDIYAIRWENNDGRSGYMPKADRDWKSYLSAKDEDRKKVDRLTRTYWPLTDDVIHGHLVGEQTVGIYPLLQDETCWLLAVDFDKKAWQEDTAAFLTACSELSVPAALERSRSGKGGHVWIFFERAIPASTARKLGCVILTRTMESRHQLGLDSYDRLFPNQDTMPKGGFGI
jgi:hypothetical protein